MNRPDGRAKDEMREIEAKVGIIPEADGSAMFRIGKTTAIAGVYGPKQAHPRHIEDPEKAVLRCYYNMYSFSVPERKRPGPNRRAIELGMVIKNALAPVIFLEEFPKTVIDIFVSITQADAGTRCAAISAASMALADAGIPMRGLVSAVAAGNINNEVVLDINKDEEDVEGATDIPIAYNPGTKQVTLLQLDGNISPEKLKEAIKLGIKGAEMIHEIQKKALKEKYVTNKSE